MSDLEASCEMADQPYSFGADADAKLPQIAEDWASGRFDESLAEAYALFLSVKDDRTSRLREAAIELIRLSAERLREGHQNPKEEAIACSFCGKSASDVRLGAGPNVFICHECVETFYSVL